MGNRILSTTWGGVERDVTLSRNFWISKYPITQFQYESVKGENPSHFGGNPDYPVENVTWYNAKEYALRVGGRLPTEAEWEFAAKGGNLSQGFIYSGSNNLEEVGWFSTNCQTPQAVGQKLPNELGLYDMSGNVWEWTSDWQSDFGTGKIADPSGPFSGTHRLIRGGSFNYGAGRSMTAFRADQWPSEGYYNVGFRVVFDETDIVCAEQTETHE